MPLLDETDDFDDLEPGFVRGDDSWQADGVCRQVGYEPFFRDGKGGQNAYDQARKICVQCPVVSQCLEYALSTHQQWGCWGGTSPRERRALARDAA